MEMFHEFVIEGQPLLARGFLTGVLLASGAKVSDVLYAAEHEVETEGLMARLAEWAHVAASETFVLTPNSKADLLDQLLREARESLGLKLNRRRAIRSARFDFNFTVYNRRQKAELDGMLRSDSALVLSDYHPTETVDISAKGVEVYSPTHEYEASGKGGIKGPLLPLLSLRSRLKTNAFIKLSKVHLEF